MTVDANGVATAATFSPLAIGTLPGGVAPTATRERDAHADGIVHHDPGRHGHGGHGHGHGDGDGHRDGHARGHRDAHAHGDVHGQRVAVVRRHTGPVGVRRPGPDAFPRPASGGWHNRIGHPHHM